VIKNKIIILCDGILQGLSSVIRLNDIVIWHI